MKEVTSLCSTILQPFQFEPEHKKTCGIESHRPSGAGGGGGAERASAPPQKKKKKKKVF